MTIKELRKECAERDVGFGNNWTKPTLINRLEEEDERDKAINNPLKVWVNLHRDLNNAKAKLSYIDEELQPIVLRKNELAAQRDSQAKLIKKLELSIETLAQTGMFGDYEEKDGMLYHDFDPNRPIK